jgi:hypothetical protein
VHILDVRDLKEVPRVGAADAQNGTPALAVDPFLAMHATYHEFAMLLCIRPVDIR